MVVLNRYAPQLASSSFSLIFVSIEEGVSIEEALYVMFCSADMPCYVMLRICCCPSRKMQRFITDPVLHERCSP